MQIADCSALRDNLQASLPTPRPKRSRPQRKAIVLVALNAHGAILLQRRPPSGIWGGLWTFPQFECESDLQVFSGQAPVVNHRLPSYHHSFTHFDLELQPLLIRNVQRSLVADNDSYCWYDPIRPPRIGLAKPVVDIIRQLAVATQ